MVCWGGKGGSSTIVNGMVQTREGQMDGVGVGGRAIRTELEEMVSQVKEAHRLWK